MKNSFFSNNDLRTLPSPFGAPRTRAAASLSLPILLASLGSAQEGKPAPALVAPIDVDVKTEAWTAPLKDGVAPADLTHLSAEERRSFDAALAPEARRRDTALPLDPSKDGSPDPSRAVSGVDPLGFHQLDVAPDGALWAYGGRYKARFGVDGASYVPFFGADAPRNFPVTFRLGAVTRGGEAVGFDREAAPRFVGDTAVYDRGTLQERYETAVGEVEQLFVFEQLTGAGDLVVALDVESELVGAEAADGLAWSNGHGTVRYSSAIAIDGSGRRAAIPTELVDGDVRLTVPAAFLAGARMPLTIDPVLSTFTPSNTTLPDLNADIAYDLVSSRYFMVWERAYSATDHDIWGEMFDVNGAAIPNTGQFLDFTTNLWVRPKVAYNRVATQFLCAATLATSTNTTIWGRTREAESNQMGPQFQISSAFGNANFADVGGDPNGAAPTWYCVVWEREFNIGVDHDILAQLVAADSTLHPAGVIQVDNSSSTYDKYPSVSKSNGIEPAGSQEWNFAWVRYFSATDWDVRGAQVHWDGVVSTPSFSVDFSSRNDFLAKVSSPLDPTSGPRTYLVTYQRFDQGEWNIYATACIGGTVIGRRDLSVLWGLPVGIDEEYPTVDSSGEHFAVAFQRRFVVGSADFDVYVASVYLAGTTFYSAELPVNLAFSSSFEGFAEICGRRSAGEPNNQFGVVWADDGQGGEVEGGVYALPAHYGQIGWHYCATNPNSTGARSVLHVTGTRFRSANQLVLEARHTPLNATLFFLVSPGGTFSPNPGGSQGVLCLAGGIGRFVGPGQVQNTGADGYASLAVNLGQLPRPTGFVSVAAGQTWHFQGWHRDVTSGGALTSNFTNGANVLFY